MKFKAVISKFESGLWRYHIMVPDDVYINMTSDGKKRVLCTINRYEAFHAGFMPSGNGQYFITLNNEKMKKFDLNFGIEVQVVMEKDNSKYGMDISEEFNEVLEQDIEGASFFEKLTEGKKRNLIYAVSMAKKSDTRITKALIILDHLKANEGKLDYKELYEALKSKNNNYQ